MSEGPKKPLLRGYIHQEAFFVSLTACAFLFAHSTGRVSFIACLLYSMGLILLFGFSAVYHRVTWQPRARANLKRIDHSAIFVLIAGTTSPIALLALPEDSGNTLLRLIWFGAVVGILQSIFWVKAPKWVTALLCVIVGWLSLPYMSGLSETLAPGEVPLLVLGGIAYSIGALFYALKKPNFFPGVFGYHELFHIFTVLAAALHFLVIYSLVGRSQI